jgi:hypothetical protein
MLKPEASIGVGLATCAVVFAIHSNATPSIADMQSLPAGNTDVDTAERKATYLSAGVVAAISLLAKDPTIFVLGSAAAIAMAWMTRRAVHTESNTAMLSPGPGISATSANDLAAGPQMTTADYHMFSANDFVSS